MSQAAPRVFPATTPRRVTILGATGSIGGSTLRVMQHNPEAFTLEAITAMSNVEGLITLARQHKPRMAVIGDAAHLDALKRGLSGTGIQVAAGAEALAEAAMHPAEVVVSAIVGAAGLKPTLAAVCRGATVALANKECLVAAGELLLAAAREHDAAIIPVDSEHNALFQVFALEHRAAITKLTLTASGGPFRGYTRAQMEKVTPEQAVKHPNWNMGAKISVDSATLMNKGLELIEACCLFDMEPKNVEVLVHPQSIIHGMVHYADGSVLAGLSCPDMATPIAHALAWPQRIAAPVKTLELTQLTFEKPDENNFPALRLAREAAESGLAARIALNAANEIAVQAFLDGKIPFLAIADSVEKILSSTPARAPQTLEEVLALDKETRTKTQGLLC